MSKQEDAVPTLQELAESVCRDLIAAGTDPEVAKAFVCFRFHPQCPWGLGRVKVNDMFTYAIVRPTGESFENVECVFIATNEKLTGISELQGLEQVPEKGKMN
jgi:hypothetical protein